MEEEEIMQDDQEFTRRELVPKDTDLIDEEQGPRRCEGTQSDPETLDNDTVMDLANQEENLAFVAAGVEEMVKQSMYRTILCCSVL